MEAEPCVANRNPVTGGELTPAGGGNLGTAQCRAVAGMQVFEEKACPLLTDTCMVTTGEWVIQPDCTAGIAPKIDGICQFDALAFMLSR
jgi:hypothetical protein